MAAPEDIQKKLEAFQAGARAFATRFVRSIPGDAAKPTGLFKTTPFDHHSFIPEANVVLNRTDGHAVFSIDFKLDNSSQAQFGGVYVPGPKDGIIDMFFAPGSGWGDKGMGHQVLRRFIYMASDYCDYVCTKRMGGSATYFSGMGFVAISGTLDIRLALQDGVTLDKMIEEYPQPKPIRVADGTPNAVDGYIHPRGFVDLTGPQRAAVWEKLKLPVASRAP